MATKDHQDGSDEFRIIEDEVEEIVRLDAPRRAPIQRKDEGLEDRSLPQMMGEAEVVEEMKAAVSDPEVEWLEAAGKKDVRAVPMGWFVLFGMVITGIIFWAVTQKSASGTDNGLAQTNAGRSQLERPLSEFEEQQATTSAAEHYKKMETVVTGFLEAKTLEERARFVRDPERVLPLMEDYYSREEFKTFQFNQVAEYHVVSLNNFPFMALGVGLVDGSDVPLLIEDGMTGMRVDWESFVCYQPMTFEDFLKSRPENPVQLRVYATRDTFYAYEFADESKYVCFKLTGRDSDLSFFGYLEKGSELEEEFRKISPESSPRLINPMILSLAFLPDSRAPRSVKIEGLLSQLWAYPPSNQNNQETKGH